MNTTIATDMARPGPPATTCFPGTPGGLGIIVAPTGTGATLLLQQLCMSQVRETGIPLFITTELAPAQARARFEQLIRGLRVHGGTMVLDDSTAAPRTAGHIERAVTQWLRTPGGRHTLVCMDMLERMQQPRALSSQDAMVRSTHDLAAIAMRYGITLWTTVTARAGELANAYGGSRLADAASVVIGLQQHCAPGPMRLTVLKSRYSKTGSTAVLRDQNLVLRVVPEAWARANALTEART